MTIMSSNSCQLVKFVAKKTALERRFTIIMEGI